MAATYTLEEISAIAQAPMLTGMAIALVDMGLVSSAIEATAMSKQIVGAAEKYPNNSIIQAAFSQEALKGGAAKMEKPDIKAEDVQSGALIDGAIAAVHNAVSIVDGKATAEEIQQYKEFIYSCGEAVANAAGSGLFGSGTKVSDKESAALARLKSALAL